ncbi:MAG: glucosaminidase domain-containing protein [Bacteroidales bacterium]
MIRKYTILFFLSFCLLYPSIVYGKKGGDGITPIEYIDTYKEIAIKKRNEYNIPASITLAQGFLESGFGNSPLALEARNHFGIKCHLEWEGERYYQDDDARDECFRKYDKPETSYDDHSLFLTSRSRYDFLFTYKVTEYKKWAHGLKKAGYATNPQYAEKLIELIERYNLHIYDTMSIDSAKNFSHTQAVAKPILEKARDTIPPAPEKETVPENAITKTTDKPDTSADRCRLKIGRHNRIKFVVARRNDSPETIADEMDMRTWQINRYNELDDGIKIQAGDTIYLQPKRRKGSGKYHTVKKGESMYEISQRYGIKLKHLYRKNRMRRGSEPETGQRLWMRRRKPRD